MISLLPEQISFNSHKEHICDYKTYILYRKGVYKTCRRATAIELLKSGWHDKTKYQKNEEVLNYGLQTELNPESGRIGTWDARSSRQEYGSTQRQHEEICSGSGSSSEWKESGHEQHQSGLCNDSRKEYSLQTIRPGSQCSEITKKRGRPKKVK
jgi:hypothetical protein